MKRVAVWLSTIVCFFGSCQLYAAPSKCTSAGRAIVFLFRFAREHNWPRWVILTLVVVGLLVSVGGIAEYFSDKKKNERNNMKKEMIATIGMFCAASLFAQAFNTTHYAPNGGYGGSSQTTRNGNSTRTTFYNQNGTYGGSAQTFGAGAGTQTTFYNQNGMYGGSARTSQNGNTVNTSYYNANGLYGGRSQSTTFGNQTTTQHYGANGMPAGRSVTTTFGNQTTTRHYNQYGMPAGSSTQYNNTFSQPSRARGFLSQSRN